ncbi:ribokinase [Halobacillus salinarum]|uniref:Ribokinase n=1 Tax=Halobacillus salinarum TaxID=2932257 RepID=A0ABY4EP75_9BACI|nr:ribokinase [Halobacillus salinarum]UOQ45663.1 ribokinase [Halobacillus salinarum]
MKQPVVTVVGSINMDLTISTNTIPAQGETVLGNHFHTYPGGKGANQAVAASRLGAHVNMIGAVGNDVFGKGLLDHLHREGIHTNGIRTFNHVGTGTATIILSDQDNRIIVAQGANKEVTPELVSEEEAIIAESDILLMQLEIPIETVEYTLSMANSHEIPVIINPAPYQPMSENILLKAAYLTPNQLEWKQLSKHHNLENRLDQFVITQGRYGAVLYQKGEKRRLPAHLVSVEDTTGAGDAFNGALAAQLAEGADLEQAVTLANAAAALSITKQGAQTGMPSRNEVEAFLKTQ